MRIKPEYISIIIFIAVYQLEVIIIHNSWLLALFPLIALIYFVKNIKIRFKDSYKGILYALILIFIILEPAIAFKKIKLIFIINAIPNILLYSLILAFSFSMLFLVITRSNKKAAVRNIFLSSVIFALSSVPYSAYMDVKNLFSLILFELLFLILAGFLSEFIYYKSDFNFLLLFLFLFVFYFYSNLTILIYVSKYFQLVYSVIAISATLLIVQYTLKGNVYINKILKEKRKPRIKVNKRMEKGTVILIASMLAFAGIAYIINSEHYVVADPTGSMYPVIKPGSLLFVEPVNPKTVKIGDIIEFNAPWKNGVYYAHEIIRICYINGSEYVRTKGVANPSEDPMPVPLKNIVGIVVFNLPYAGYPIIYSKLTLAIIISILIVFISIPEKRRYKQHFKSRLK
ncbi:signal peptidase I [Picrophilus oshimae]|uniref:Signal peptidase I n=1 Tax=Picrophilus torridus (strain ATCC 700027 / DSM 9790 / JCM 10055 / NBRC 100828 / KAW 2/3) TaxID=1122961 RepID=Q6L0J3_PICTO|nr:signal peptidase I [Picrophilus oshimae]AAT43509.1 signal peptidase I [Picrophilus oshimae DSM 9789]